MFGITDIIIEILGNIGEVATTLLGTIFGSL